MTTLVIKELETENNNLASRVWSLESQAFRQVAMYNKLVDENNELKAQIVNLTVRDIR